MGCHFIDGKLVACDTETTGLFTYLGHQPFAFSFCNAVGERAYFEWMVNPKTREVIVDEEEWKQMRDFFEDERVTKVFHHAKFDVRHLEKMKLIVCGPGGAVREGGRLEETVLSSHAINSRERSYELKMLALRLGIPLDDQDELVKAVRRLRHYAKKDGWKIGVEEKVNSDGDKKEKAQVNTDYWIPNTAWHRHKSWVKRSERNLCRVYAEKDAERTMLLHLSNREGMKRLDVRDTYEREIELWDTVYRMESRGPTVHIDRIKDDMRRAKKLMGEIKEEVEEKHGWKGINLRSPAQVAKMLFDKCKVPLAKRRKIKGKWTSPRSTALDALVQHSSIPAVSALLKYRTCEKGVGSFYLKYLRMGVREDSLPGRLVLHASFKQTGTDTARFSCSDPNLQQVSSPESSRHGAVMDIRYVFGPRPEHFWLASDYDGQEIRLYAEVSQEPNMMKALAEGRDIHSMIISRICGGEGNEISLKAGVRALGLDGRTIRPTPEVEEALRELGANKKSYSEPDALKISRAWLHHHRWDIEKAEKSIKKKNTRGRLKQSTFGKCYGASANTLAETLGVDKSEAKFLMGVYDDEFPDMDAFMRESIKQARADGYIITLWNRKLRIDVEKAYTAVNYKCQGAAADLIKHAMENLDQWARKNGHECFILMPIHDEIISELHERHRTIKFIKEYANVMEDHGGFLKYRIPTKPLIILDSWSTPRMIKGYPYAS